MEWHESHPFGFFTQVQTREQLYFHPSLFIFKNSQHILSCLRSVFKGGLDHV